MTRHFLYWLFLVYRIWVFHEYVRTGEITLFFKPVVARGIFIGPYWIYYGSSSPFLEISFF